ncbi:MAG: maleylpyruvate isomerase family mycothiol-dependent enzyme [Acidimicrobiia bacterium]|nr:maleylpyruvate isomerase family mycothiol-dependent enzyme [Acidimicrobiia bacterium]MDH4364112.1 maleylpyruvate isomerase family mycothiol-dependent enzyme [Acidimicrobiia bacterium]MDH5289787.1 maleylpyruvate isomerase family mycothiol-dependent enzyme [Acidimicrobiia bacterium]
MTDLFPLISRQRRAVADVLETLDEPEWATPSLCAQWTVKEVAVHLIMPFQVKLPSMVLRMVKARGDFNRVADEFARATAPTMATEAVVAALRANAEHRFTPPGNGPEAPLTDIVVHGLDLGVPLGKLPELPEGTVNAVLAFLMTTKATRGFLPKDRVPGLHFATTDTGWAGGGAGPEVAGPAASLVLAITGRRAGLEGLTGDGVAELGRRIGS